MGAKKDIHFLIMGGTIDSFYNPRMDTATPRSKSVLPDYLKSLRLNIKIIFTEVCMKDSRDVKDSDRKKLCRSIEASKSKRIIISHGTYTMPETARFLEKHLKRTDQSIILTGSMIPLEGFSPSDAPFNLGFAIAEIARLDPGVYVAMNGSIFNPKEVKKDIKEGKFTSVFSH